MERDTERRRRSLLELLKRVETRAPVSRVEAPLRFTRAYCAMEIAWGLARLDDPDGAERLRSEGAEALDRLEPLHDFAVRAYTGRIADAAAGRPPLR